MRPRVIQVRIDTCQDCKLACEVRGVINHADPCAECPARVWHAHGDCENPPLPSLVAMAGNAAQAAVEEALAIARGDAAPAIEDIAARLSLCQACAQYRPADERCAACGCYLALKTAARAARCPLGKW